MQPVIELQRVSVRYGRQFALRDRDDPLHSLQLAREGTSALRRDAEPPPMAAVVGVVRGRVELADP